MEWLCFFIAIVRRGSSLAAYLHISHAKDIFYRAARDSGASRRAQHRHTQIRTRLSADADKSSHVPSSGGTSAASRLVRSRLTVSAPRIPLRRLVRSYNGSRELVFVAHPKSGEIQRICRDIRCGSRLGDDSRQICYGRLSGHVLDGVRHGHADL
jgi:hypothetical protein